ncbi:hypothetical protein OHA25_41455 [Nonomuraea sp. NBC_00507]|uniref:hypothetical protein n=1 Tax=Nonomuraea sp. NBC_00507 TaxID=2976002 RepID=UPI002E16BDE8
MADLFPVPERRTPPRMPRWVKAAGIVIGILVLGFTITLLTGLGGEHGPGRHMPAGSGVTDQQAPAGSGNK